MQDSASRLALLCCHDKDRPWLERLQIHLEPLVRQGALTYWSEYEIQPGADREAELGRAVKRACVVMLLVSADYIASAASQHMLQTAREHRLTVLLLPLGPCNLEAPEFCGITQLLKQDCELASLRRESIERELKRISQELVRAVKAAHGENIASNFSSTNEPEFSHIKLAQKSKNRFRVIKHNHTKLAFAITALGTILSTVAAIGSSAAEVNYQRLFVSIGAMGGFYLIFGLFFAKLSLFPERHRAWILGILLAAFVFITIALAARIAGCYLLIRRNYDTAKPVVKNEPKLVELLINDMSCVTDLSSPSNPNNEDKPKTSDAFKSIDLSNRHLFLGSTEELNSGALIQDMAVNFAPKVLDANFFSDLSTRVFKAPKPVPESFIRADIIYEEAPHLSYQSKLNYMCQEVNGSYKICINEAGDVSEVHVLISIPSADDDIMDTFFKWKFRSQKQPVCFIKNLYFFVEHPKGCPPIIKTAAEMNEKKISQGDVPLLTNMAKELSRNRMLQALYKVCINPNGTVASVSPTLSIVKSNTNLTVSEDENLMNYIRKWKFAPLSRETCFTQGLEYHVE